MRHLSLKRERLAELTANELLSVAGGANATVNGLTCPLLTCVGPQPSVPQYETCHCCTASDSCTR